MKNESSLLAVIEDMKKKSPRYFDLLTAETEEEFDEAFDAILERAVSGLEGNAKNYHELGEVGLTAVLAQAIDMPGLVATQETNSNGHVDITIVAEYCSPIRKKLGEAKIYDGPVNHIGGLTQLMNRYTTGREGRGLLIEYVRKKDIAGLIKSVRAEMDGTLPCQQQGSTRDHPVKWWFLSRHAHSCGEMLGVCHIGCNLFWE